MSYEDETPLTEGKTLFHMHSRQLPLDIFQTCARILLKRLAADGRGTICLLGARRDWYVSVGTYSMQNYVGGRTKEERRDGIYAPLGGLNK